MTTESNLNEDQIETHSAADEQGLINELNGVDFDPTVSEVMTGKDAALLATGATSVMTVLGVTEQLLKQFGHKDFNFDPSQAENVANVTAPLFLKYGGEMPPWMAEYKEEITCLVAVGGLGFGTFAQLKQLKAFDAAKEVPQEKEVEGATDAAD